MLLGRSQAVPDGREEETHPMGRFFTVFSSASGICHWQRQYKGHHSDPVCMSLYSCYWLFSYLFITFVNFFLAHTWIQSLSVSPLWVDDGGECDSSPAHGLSSQACDNPGDSNLVRGVQRFFLILKKNCSDIVYSFLTAQWIWSPTTH